MSIGHRWAAQKAHFTQAQGRLEGMLVQGRSACGRAHYAGVYACSCWGRVNEASLTVLGCIGQRLGLWPCRASWSSAGHCLPLRQTRLHQGLTKWGLLSLPELSAGEGVACSEPANDTGSFRLQTHKLTTRNAGAGLDPVTGPHRRPGRPDTMAGR